jgi:hypothetical protein
MAKTQINSDQIGIGEVTREDLNTADTGLAVVAKIVQGSGITIQSTGVDSGTGDVTISATGNYEGDVQNKNANYTALLTDNAIFVDASGGQVTISLPTATGNASKKYYIKKLDSSANKVVIDPYGSQQIEGATTAELWFQDEAVAIKTDGLSWYVI